MSDKMKNIYIIFCCLCLGIVVFFFGMIDAFAFETIMPYGTTIYNNTTYYKYHIPTRFGGGEDQAYYTSVYHKNINYNGDEILTRESDLLLTPSWSERIENANPVISKNLKSADPLTNVATNSYLLDYGRFKYYMGASGNNSDMLSNAGVFNYNNYYDFKFDITTFSDYEYSNTFALDSNNRLRTGYTLLEVINTDPVSSSDRGFCEAINFQKGKVSDLGLTGINFTYYNIVTMSCSHAKFNIDNNSIIGFIRRSGTGSLFGAKNPAGNQCLLSQQCAKDPFSFIVSEPYNLVLYSTSQSLYTEGNLVTQDDVDNHNEDYSRNNLDNLDSTSYINNIFNLDFFGDYSISSILILFRDFFTSIFDNTNNTTCNVVNIPVLGTNITLDCGANFWNRNDISTFKNLWETLLNCIISLWVIRLIYKEILNTFNPTKSSDVSEVLKL